jgi:hypothetical protein
MLSFKQYLILENDAETGSFNMGQWSKNYKDEVDEIYKDLYQKHKNDIDPFTLDTYFGGNRDEYIRTKFMNPEERSMSGRATSYMYSPLDIDDPKYNDSLVKLRNDPAPPDTFQRQLYTSQEPVDVIFGTTPNEKPVIDYKKPVLDQDLSTTYPAPGEIKPSTSGRTQSAKSSPNITINPPQSDASRWQARLSIGKGVGKTLLKTLPVIGTAASIASMAQKAQAGDYVGAGLEAASEVADYIPGIGTAASLGIQGYLADRDMPEEEKKKQKSTTARQNLRSIGQDIQNIN